MDRAAYRMQKIREYLSKMTPGPWFFESLYDHQMEVLVSGEVEDDERPSKHAAVLIHGGQTGDAEIQDNWEGIAALRTDAEWLLSQLSAYEERVRWIPVSEKYPSIGEIVLVYMHDGDRRYMDVWQFDNRNQYFCDHTPKKAIDHSVTHWMPLPAPPPVAKDCNEVVMTNRGPAHNQQGDGDMLMTSDGRIFVYGLFSADGYECESLEGIFASAELANKRKEEIQAQSQTSDGPRPYRFSEQCYGNPDLLEIRQLEVATTV